MTQPPAPQPDARPGRTSTLRQVLPALIVLAGLAGLVTVTEASGRAARLVQAVGAGWHAVDEQGAVLQPRRGERGLVLEAGARLRLDEPEGPLQRYESLSITGRKIGPAGWLELRLRDDGATAWSLALAPGAQDALFVSRHEGGETRVIERMAAPSLAVDPFAGFRLDLRLDGSRLSATLNGREELSADLGPDAVGAVSIQAGNGALRLLSLEVRGTRTSQRGRPEPFAWKEDFGDLAAVSPWPGRLRTAGLGLLGLAAAAAFLGSVCRGRPGSQRLVRATLWWATPPALVVAVSVVATDSPPPWMPAAVAGAALVGLLPALRAVRQALGPTPGTDPRPGRLALAATLLVAAAGFVAYARVEALGPARQAASEARAAPLPPPAKDPSRVRLDPSNALTLEGPYRNLVFRTRVRLAPRSALQVRLRAADPDVPQGVTLVLSSDDRRPTSFRREEPWTFAPHGDRGPALAPDRWVELDVRVTGHRFEAFVDGELVARADSRDHAAGAVVLTAGPGSADLDGWALEPRAHETAASPWLDGLPPFLWLTGGFVLLAALLAWALALPLGDALAPQPWALVPVLAVVAGADPAGLPDGNTLLAAGQATGALLVVFCVIHARGVPTALALAAALVLPPLILRQAVERAPDPGLVASYAHWSGARAHDDLLWIDHPLFRRWNPYLARHRFRGRHFDLAPAEGTRRVVVLGGSSTWGFRLPEDAEADWPTQLGKLLAEQGRTDVEVINGAWSGATGDRLYRFLRDVLLDFEPDVVVLDLYYNDAWALSQGAEEEYYARITADDYRRGWLDAWRDGREVAAGRAHLRRLMAATAPGRGGLAGRTTQQVWDAVAPGRRSPAARYAEMLERFVRLARQAGFALVLVKEPMRDDQESLWKDEFHAVMDRLAREHDLPLVDPRERLRAASQARLFLDEIHLTPRGHAVLAEAVAPAVLDALQAVGR